MTKRKMQILFNIFALIVGLLTIVSMPYLLPIGLGAVLTSGILGPGKGKVGGAVMSKWKAINYIRGYAVPSNPQTVDQTAHRVKFKAIVVLAQKLMSLCIPQNWDPFYNTMSGFNAFVKDNFSLLDGTNKLTSSIITSKGTLEPVILSSCVYTTGTGSMSLVWVGDIFGNGLSTDTLFFVVFDKSDNEIIFQGNLPTVDRSDEAATVIGKTGRTASNLVACLTAYRGTGEDYMQSNNSNVVGS
jgi:hypothetical protein